MTELKSIRTSFKLNSSPKKIANRIHKDILKKGADEALVEVPNSEDTLIVPASAPVKEIEKVIKQEQLKYK